MNKLLTVLTFLLLAFHSTIAQTEKEFQAFKTRQDSCEKVFIKFIKQGKVDSCLKYISYTVQNKYGYDSLKREFLRLREFYNKYPNPTNKVNFGQSTNGGVGAFGHNSTGKFEKQSTYQFKDAKDDVIYYFTLYYSDREPVSIIRFYDSKELSDYKKFDKIKTKAPGQN
jgi:hypothetical protein